jgi:methylmalonyl-CoA/ethylmalonyl-CoA epimerase
MKATSPDGEVAKFIEQKGEGIFVVSYEMSDVDEALQQLKSQGRTLIDEKPRHLFGSRYAFTLHPKELCGILTEIIDYGKNE